MAAVATDKAYVGWVLDLGRVSFERVLNWQHGLVKLRREGMARDTLILVEHPPVITVGKDGHEENYKDCPVEPFFIERGGDVTYHGPGQLVAYFIFNLTRRGRDIRLLMDNIQKGVIAALAEIDIAARPGDEHTGVWIDERKIASIGVAVKNWISYHGVAINLNTDMAEFVRINPCGLSADTMISAASVLGQPVDMTRFGSILVDKYSTVFDTAFYPVKLEDIAEDVASQSGSNVI